MTGTLTVRNRRRSGFDHAADPAVRGGLRARVFRMSIRCWDDFGRTYSMGRRCPSVRRRGRQPKGSGFVMSALESPATASPTTQMRRALRTQRARSKHAASKSTPTKTMSMSITAAKI